MHTPNLESSGASDIKSCLEISQMCVACDSENESLQTCICLSFRSDIYKLQMILKLCTA